MGVVRYTGIGMVTEDEFNTGLAGKLDKPDVEGTTGQVLTKTSGGSEEWATIPSTGTPADDTMSDSSTNAPQNKVVKAYVDSAVEAIGDALDTKANKDGYYNQMTVGLAENLLDTKGQGSEQNFTFRTSCGDVSIADDGAGIIQTIKGNTLKWDQLVAIPATDISRTINYVTFTDNRDGSYTVNGTATDGDAVFNIANIDIPGSHKFLYKGCPKGGSNTTYKLNGSMVDDYGDGAIYTAPSGGGNQMYGIIVREGVTVNNLAFRPNIIDLTVIFGAGNEPSTVAEFTALFPESYYAYNAGTLLPFKGTGLKTNGFNQWDEEWEEGTILPSTGQNYAADDRIRSKNYIAVFPGTEYYFKGLIGYLYFYDANKNFVSCKNTSTNNTTYTIPAGCYYLRFICDSAYGTTYNHDICINLSWSGYRNGEYESFWEQTTNINVVGKSATDADGNAIVPFPEGMNGVGAYFDKATRDGGNLVFGGLDMGTLSWSKEAESVFMAILSDNLANNKNFICSASYTVQNPGYYNSAYNDKSIWLDARSGNHAIYVKDSAYSDAASFKSAMNGVELVYLLETEIPFTWDEPINLTYRVADFGTETLLPQGVDTNGVPKTAPFDAIIKYNDDFTRTLANLKKNFISKESLVNALTELATRGIIGTFTPATDMVYNETTCEYDFTFTNPNEEE